MDLGNRLRTVLAVDYQQRLETLLSEGEGFATCVQKHGMAARCLPGLLFFLSLASLPLINTGSCVTRHDLRPHPHSLPELYCGFAELHLIRYQCPPVHRWVTENTQTCPRCYVIVQRSEGCPSMLCLCGCRFCYTCGKNIGECHGHPVPRPPVQQPATAVGDEARNP